MGAVAAPANDDADPEPDLLGGVVTLCGEGLVAPGNGWEGCLYRPAAPLPAGDGKPVALKAVPYYTWANREPGPMQVWIRSE